MGFLIRRLGLGFFFFFEIRIRIKEEYDDIMAIKTVSGINIQNLKISFSPLFLIFHDRCNKSILCFMMGFWDMYVEFM